MTFFLLLIFEKNSLNYFLGLAIQAALNFGLTVAFIMHMINHISFAVINPSITVVALGFGKLSIRVRINLGYGQGKKSIKNAS